MKGFILQANTETKRWNTGKKMEAKSTDGRRFKLIDKGQPLGEIIYNNAFTLKAEIYLTDGDRYKIAPKGIFGTSVTLTKNEVEVATFVMNWSGHIVITIPNRDEFIFRLNGFFSNKYILENKEHEQLIQLEFNFIWRKLQYQYNITCNVEYQNNEENILLLLLCIYSVNYYAATLLGMS